MESGDREGHCAANCENKCTSSYYTEGDIDEKFDEILHMINRAAIFCTPTSLSSNRWTSLEIGMKL